MDVHRILSHALHLRIDIGHPSMVDDMPPTQPKSRDIILDHQICAYSIRHRMSFHFTPAQLTPLRDRNMIRYLYPNAGMLLGLPS